MSEYAIDVQNLSKSFGSSKILQDVSFSVKKGEIIVIIGESGCGKSVLLRCLEGLDGIDSGEILIDGESIVGKKDLTLIHQKMGMVYQNFNLFSNMNVIDNLCLAPCKLKHMPRKDAEKKALEWLGKVGLKDRAFKMPSSLSGGQKQRVAIARCLMMDPEILLFDEPTSALDPSMVGEVLATIRMLSKLGITMMIVTHEMYLAKQIADRIFFMAERGIYEQGTPDEIMEAPKRSLTIAFINRLKELRYHIDRHDYDAMNMQGEMIIFAMKYGIDSKKTFRMQLCVEEIVEEYMKVFKDKEPDIDIFIKYFEVNRELKIIITASCAQYNIFTLNDDLDYLGIVIVKKVAKEYTYNYENGKNIIEILFES